MSKTPNKSKSAAISDVRLGATLSFLERNTFEDVVLSEDSSKEDTRKAKNKLSEDRKAKVNFLIAEMQSFEIYFDENFVEFEVQTALDEIKNRIEVGISRYYVFTGENESEDFFAELNGAITFRMVSATLIDLMLGAEIGKSDFALQSNMIEFFKVITKHSLPEKESSDAEQFEEGFGGFEAGSLDEKEAKRQQLIDHDVDPETEEERKDREWDEQMRYEEDQCDHPLLESELDPHAGVEFADEHEDVEPEGLTVEEQVGIASDYALEGKPVAVDELEVDTGTEEVADFTEEDSRKKMIEILLGYEDNEMNKEAMRTVYSAMTTERLAENLRVLTAEWGGSAAYKHAQTEAEKVIHEAYNSKETEARITVLNEKHREYHSLAAKVSQALGKDVVIDGMRHIEYHETLKKNIQNLDALAAAIKHMANLVGYPVPESIDVSGTNDLKSLIRSCIYMGTTSRNWLLAATGLRKDMADRDQTIDGLRRELEASKAREKAVHEVVDDLRKKAAKQDYKSFGTRLGLAMPGGQLIGLNHELVKGEKIKYQDVVLTSQMNRALLVESSNQLDKLQDAIENWARKYPKTFDKKGINPSHLMQITVKVEKI